MPRRSDSTPDLLAQATRLAPKLGRIQQALELEPDALLAHAFPAPDTALAPGALMASADEVARTIQEHRKRVLGDGRAGLRKLQTEGSDAQLTQAEATGLEAIIFAIARPAILVRSGKFLEPADEEWRNLLEQFRGGIEETLQSVGRIQLAGHRRLPWAGTGFLVAADVVMSNAHVAEAFTDRDSEGRWVFRSGLSASIDYVEDPDTDPPLEFAIQGIIGLHDQLDLALFRIEPASDRPAPKPLTLATQVESTAAGRKVYVIGYPTRDARNGEELMRQIFDDIFNVKRLQPGEIMAVFEEERAFNHDASTLGGNSGSCVVDLESNQVIGLHFAGRYLQYNRAVALWSLADDTLLKEAGVVFG